MRRVDPSPSSAGAASRRARRPALVVGVLAFAIACDMPTPMAPAEPIGEVPRWGESFVQPTASHPASMLGAEEDAPTPSPAVPAGTPSPGATGDWSGGDAQLGAGVWTALCARCHGQNGEGGVVPGAGAVPSFQDPAWQQRMSDREIARAVALGKGAMPAFMSQMNREQLSGVVAHIRTLKKQP